MGQGVRPRLTLEGNTALLSMRGYLSEQAGRSLSVNETVLLARSLVMAMPMTDLRREVLVWKQRRTGQGARTIPGQSGPGVRS